MTGAAPEHPGADRLRELLTQSRELGFLGPGPIEAHISHGLDFARAVGNPPKHFLDLGSGGGVPGLILALEWPAAEALLLDAMARRAEFLADAVTQLGVGDRVKVSWARAEDAAREPELRATFDLVVSRSFGAPAITAECAAGFLEAGGRMVVSEPPEAAPDRWPDGSLAELGFSAVDLEPSDHHFAGFRVDAPADERWPRRVGIPAKRPLWS